MERSAVNPDAAGTPTTSAQASAAGSAAPPMPPASVTAPGSAPGAGPGTARAPLSPQRDVREPWEMKLRRKKLVRWMVSWLPHRLTISIRGLLRWEHSMIAMVRLRWRRSLQLRVVGTTLVISATMIAILGFFLTEQIATGLQVNAGSAARAQTLGGINTARGSLSGNLYVPPKPNAAQQFMNTVAKELQPVITGTAPPYYVIVGLNRNLISGPLASKEEL